MTAKPSLERRDFIVAVGTVAAATCLPVALALATPGVGQAEPQADVDGWTIDDMWGVYPRPSEPIGYGRPHGDGELLAGVHPADLQFIV